MGFFANNLNDDFKYKCNTILFVFFIAVGKCKFFFKGRIIFLALRDDQMKRHYPFFLIDLSPLSVRIGFVFLSLEEHYLNATRLLFPDTVLQPVMLSFYVNTVTCVSKLVLLIIVRTSHYLLCSQIKCLLLKQEHTKGMPPVIFKNTGVIQYLAYNIHPGNIIAFIFLLLKWVKTVPVVYDLKGNKTYQWSCYS